MNINIWKPGRKLARSWKSESGAQGPNIDVFYKGDNTKLITCRRLDHGNLDLEARAPKNDVFNHGGCETNRVQEAGQIMEIWIWRPGGKLTRSCKSESGGQGSKVDACNQGDNKRMISVRKLGGSFRSGCASHAIKADAFSKGRNKKLIGLTRLA